MGVWEHEGILLDLVVCLFVVSIYMLYISVCLCGSWIGWMRAKDRVFE